MIGQFHTMCPQNLMSYTLTIVHLCTEMLIYSICILRVSTEVCGVMVCKMRPIHCCKSDCHDQNVSKLEEKKSVTACKPTLRQLHLQQKAMCFH